MKTARLSKGLVFSILAASASSLVPAATFTSIITGDWGNPLSWNVVDAGFPNTYTADSAIIDATHTITYDGSIPDLGGRLVVANGNSIAINGGTLAVGVAGLTVGANGGAGTLDVTSGLATIDGPGSAESFKVGEGAGSTGTVTVSGGTLNSVNNMLIGANGGIGTFNQTGGTVTYGGWAAVGYGAGAAGSSYNISGGALTSGAGFEVGADRAGLMTISGTATVNVSAINVGIRTNGEGTLNISGGTTTVGTIGFGGAQATSTGTGTISGGTVNATNIYVGMNNGGSGTLNITGGTTTVGTLGFGGAVGASTGTGTISAGAVNATNLYVGMNNGGSGTLNITGGTTNVGLLGVGGGVGASTGVLNITGGTNTITGGGQSFIGRGTGSTGTVNINGVALNNTSGGDFHVGYQGGTGNLNITNGGTFTHNWWINIARGAGSTGQVTVDGTGSALTMTAGHLNVGEDGTGTMTVSNNAIVSTTDTVAVGRFNGSNGTLNVNSGGVVNTVGEFSIASEPGSQGSVLIGGAGSTINFQNHLYVGRSGIGTLTQTGGTLNLNGRRVQIAENGGSTGTVNLTGGSITNSQWFHVGSGGGATGNLNVNFTNPADSLTTGALYVGNSGSTGNTTVSNGRVNANDTVQVGRYGGGTGTLTVTGPNSIVSAYHAGGDDFVRVGMENGNGTVNVLAGGKFTTNNSWFTIGMQDGSTGTTTVSGAGSELTSRGLIVGWNGNSAGTLNISNGAVVNNRDREVSIGRDLNGGLATSPVGIVNVTSGGTLNAGANLRVGWKATGTLNINNGTINSAGGDVYVAEFGTSSGTVNMINGVFFHPNASLNIAQNDGAQGSFTSVNSTTTVGGELNVGRQGANADGFYNQTGGTLSVGGWFGVGRDGSTGTYTQHGGSAVFGSNVGVGNGSATGNGTLNMDGGATLSMNGDLNIGINGATGVVNLAGAGTKFTHNAGGWTVVAVGSRDGGGNGTLNISNGAVYESPRADGTFLVGWNGGGHGQVNVTSGGSLITGGEFRVALDAGGDVLVDGTGSLISVPNNTVRIGEGNTGTLTIRNNGTFTHGGGDTSIGYNSGVTGTVTIQSGGTLNASNFRIGHVNGTGIINATNGTVNASGWTILASDGGSANGTVNLTGSAFNQNGDRVDIGRNGTGVLTLSAGSTFTHTSAGETNVGGNEDGNRASSGTVTIDATSAYSTTNFMRVGHGNAGAAPAVGIVNLNGGTLALGQWIGFGHEGGDGTLNMTGGTLTTGSEFYVGIDDNGHSRQTTGVANISGNSTLNVNTMHVGRSGGLGTVNVNSGTLSVRGFARFGEGGVGAGGGQSTGTLNITGATSVVNAFTNGAADDFFRVGVGGGSGTVNIANGGRLNTNNGWFTLGENNGSVGNATVTGAGSTLTAKGLIIGWNQIATGTLTVSNGGVVNSIGHEVSIGRDLNGDLANSPTGIVNLNSGGTLNGISLRIGHGTTGTVNINGGNLNNTGGVAIVADGGSSVGNINMSSGSINTNASMNVGYTGNANGTVTQTGGATNIGNEFMLGQSGATGTLNLSGGTFNVNGWTVVGGGRDVGDGRSGGAGTGTINISNGAKFTHLQTGGDLLAGWQNGSQSTINITNGGTMEYNWWARFAVDAGSTSTMTISGVGSKFEQGTVDADTRFLVGEGGTGTINVTNRGLLKVRKGLTFGGSQEEAKTGTGTLNVAGGNVKVGGELNFGYRAGSTGNLAINAGTVTNNSWLIVGRAGTGNYTQNGGRVWNTEQELRIGNDSTGIGTVTVNNGALNSFSHGMVGESGTGTLNVNGGIVGIGCCTGGNLFISHLNGSSGTVTVGGGILDVGGSVEFNTQGGATVSVLNLNGGILATDFINNPTGNAVAILNANGGTLRATQNESNFIRGMAAGRLNLNAGGLTLDTNNFTVTSNGIFSGTGGLTKNGFGQLNLTANQTNTGVTTTSAGVLNLDFTASAAPNDLVNTSGLVLNGGTLRVTSTAVVNTQSFLGTEIASGASRVEISESGAGAGTITLGALTRTAGGTADVGVTTGIITTTNANANGILGLGLTANGNDWAKNDGSGRIVAAVAADYAATFGATNNLDVTVAGILGGGAVNSIKTAGNITLNANTTVGTGGILVPSTAGATDLFILSAGAETLTSGNALDLQVIQNNTASNLIIASQVTGAIALTKTGLGALVLANPTNSYAGGTFINSGALVIGADSALGDVNGGLTLSSSTFASGAALAVTETMALDPSRTITLNGGGGGFSVPATKTLTLEQDISGAGGLGKVGAGALVLNGNSNYTGETAIFEGSLELNGAITSTAGFTADGSVTLGSGANITSSGAFQIARNAGPTVTVTGAAVTLSGKEFTIGGSGNANVTLTGASTLAASCDLLVARLNGSTSSLNVTGGSVTGQKNVTIGAAGGATGTLSVTGGTFAVSNALTVGSGGGTGTLNLAGTTVGSFGFLDVGSGATGTVNISGTATLSGSTLGNSGYINVGNNNPGTTVVNQSGGAVSYSSWMTIGISGGSNDPTNSQYNISGGTLSSGAGIEVGADHGGTLSVSGTGAVAVSSISMGQYGNGIRGSGTAGNGVLNVSGGTVTTNEINVGNNANSGELTSNGVMNLSGGVTTVNGTLFVARNGGGGGSTGTVNLGGGELKVNTIARGAGASAQLNFNGTVIKPNASNGNFITGFDTSSTDVQAGGAIFNTDGKTLGVSTSLDGVGALTKAGTGQLQLSGDSSYAGGVNLNAGTLSVRHNNALGTGTVIANGGILSFDNTDGDGGAADYTVPNGMTLSVSSEIHVRQFGGGINGNITGGAGINKTGNGRLTLGGTNSYSGTTTIAAGVLEVGSGGATGSLGSGNVTNAGTLKFNRTGSLNVPGNISGAGPVEHNGTGTTTLAGTNTFSGATTVNAGNLRVAGSISGSITTVNVNGTLSGTGTVGTVIVSGGTLAPGASPGILNSGDVTFNGGSFSVELNGTTVGTLYDQLNVTGSVTLQSNAALAINFGYGKQIGDSFTIISNDGTDAIGGAGRFTFAGTPLADGDLFSDFGNETSLLIDYTAGSDNNDVVLTVVPEPGSLVMLMGGLAMLAGIRRRRQ